ETMCSERLSQRPCSIAQMAACVRLCFPIFRRTDFRWTLMVASDKLYCRAITLFDLPSARQVRTSRSRGDSELWPLIPSRLESGDCKSLAESVDSTVSLAVAAIE